MATRPLVPVPPPRRLIPTTGDPELDRIAEMFPASSDTSPPGAAPETKGEVIGYLEGRPITLPPELREPDRRPDPITETMSVARPDAPAAPDPGDLGGPTRPEMPVVEPGNDDK